MTKATLPPLDPPEPDSLDARIADYLEWMAQKNYAPSTMKNVKRSLGHFVAWCTERGLSRAGEVTRPIVERYARHLYHLRTDRGTALSFETQYNELSNLRCFFRHLARKNHILVNPAADLELPKLGHRLPRAALTHAEVEQVLAQVDVTTDLGVRDRAILETFYSTGIRRAELVHLTVFDIDAGRGALTVRQGKGKKDRVVPIGARALAWIARYTSAVRPGLIVDPSEHTLYVTAYGKPMSADALSYRVTKYLADADVGKRGSCHLFRHTMATLMLERGADVRIIQEILGHASLEATQIYTHVSIGHLKEVHDRTHPGAKPEAADAAAAHELAEPTMSTADAERLAAELAGDRDADA